jgi:GAF domain-containing protein
MNKSLDSLLQTIDDEVALLANAAAFMFEFIPNINWVGFYLYKQGKLVLGPFQGRTACVYIPMGKGACGRSALLKQTIILDDVTKVENYIACHEETRSEIVVPLVINDEIYGVLDVDSVTLNRFDEKAKKLFEELAQTIVDNLKLCLK